MPPWRRPECSPAERHASRSMMSTNRSHGRNFDEESARDHSTLPFLFHKQVESVHCKTSAVGIYFDFHGWRLLFILVSIQMSPLNRLFLLSYLCFLQLWDLRKLLNVSGLLFPTLQKIGRNTTYFTELFWALKDLTKVILLEQYLCILNSVIITITIVIIWTFASLPHSYPNIFTCFIFFKASPCLLFTCWFSINLNLTDKCHENTLLVSA